MNEFPWMPIKHEQPIDPVKATEEVVLDSGDQIILDPAPAQAEVVVDKPIAPQPAAKKSTPKKNVRKSSK